MQSPQVVQLVWGHLSPPPRLWGELFPNPQSSDAPAGLWPSCPQATAPPHRLHWVPPSLLTRPPCDLQFRVLLHATPPPGFTSTWNTVGEGEDHPESPALSTAACPPTYLAPCTPAPPHQPTGWSPNLHPTQGCLGPQDWLPGWSAGPHPLLGHFCPLQGTGVPPGPGDPWWEQPRGPSGRPRRGSSPPPGSPASRPVSLRWAGPGAASGMRHWQRGRGAAWPAQHPHTSVHEAGSGLTLWTCRLGITAGGPSPSRLRHAAPALSSLHRSPWSCGHVCPRGAALAFPLSTALLTSGSSPSSPHCAESPCFLENSLRASAMSVWGRWGKGCRAGASHPFLGSLCHGGAEGSHPHQTPSSPPALLWGR